MKKFFALALCALMMVSLSVAAFAADENIFEYNFEDDGEGEFIAIDNSIKPYPKQQGKTTIAKVDGSMVMKFEQVDFQDISSQMDTYMDMLGGNVSTYTDQTKYVMEYDVKIEKMEASNSWQVAMLRFSTPSGTQFQHAAYFRPTEDGKVGLQVVGIEGTVASFEYNKWMKAAVAFDNDNNVYSVYVDGVCYAKDIDFSIADTSSKDPTQIRMAWASCTAGDDAIGYVDNIAIYAGTAPRNVTVAEPVTTAAAPVTEAPVATDAATEAAPAPTAPATQTADVAVILAAVAAVAASGVVVLKKKH